MNDYARKITRTVHIGQVAVGGGNPVSVQSMCNTDTRDVAATLAQLKALAAAGAEIGRLAVPDLAAAEALADIVKESPLPLVADIHFDYRLALAAIKGGVQGLRLNPGNIGGKEKVRQVAEARNLAVLNWSVDPRDWATGNRDAIVRSVQSTAASRPRPCWNRRCPTPLFWRSRAFTISSCP